MRQACEAGVALIRPGGLLKAMTKTVIETSLEEEFSEHLGYDRHNPLGYTSGNSGNRTHAKMVFTDACGQIGIDVPGERSGTLQPQSASGA